MISQVKRRKKGSLGKEGVICLRRQDAAHCALCPAVRAQQGNSGPQLAAPRVRARRPKQAVHAPGQLWRRVVLEQQVETMTASVDACAVCTAWGAILDSTP